MARRRGPALTRRDVIEAAVRVVDRSGAGALGIHAVARALGIKAPSLYNHVASGEALKHAVAIEGWRRLGTHLAAGDRRGERPSARLERKCRRFRAFVHANQALYTVMSSTALDPDDPECREVVAAILGDFERALAPFGLTGTGALHATRGLRAAMHGFVALELGGQFGMPFAVEESYRRLTRGLIRGLERGASGSDDGRRGRVEP